MKNYRLCTRKILNTSLFLSFLPKLKSCELVTYQLIVNFLTTSCRQTSYNNLCINMILYATQERLITWGKKGGRNQTHPVNNCDVPTKSETKMIK